MKNICTNYGISAFCLACAVALTVFLFAESRNDPSLRIASLVSATGLVASLAAIASTLLTGKDVTQKGSSIDPPPGSVVTDKTVVQTPPVDPEVKP